MPAPSRTILTVEDDTDLLFLVEVVLAEEGYRVWTAGNGREALDVLERDGLPDLILLDIKMPVMNGREFAREFHSRFGRGVPVVVVTASEDAQARAIEVGADGWLGKPFAPEELIAVVRRYLPPTGSPLRFEACPG